MNDNVYPGGSYYPSEPVSQVKERDEEVSKTLLAIPRLQEAVDYLDERIAFYGSLDSIDPGLLTMPNDFMHVVAGNKVAKANLEIERDWFIGLIQEAAKE